MSASAVGLRSASRVTLVAGAPGKPCGKIQHLPRDCFSQILSYLNPPELASAERVDRVWRGTINAEDQDPWKEQCHTQGITVITPEVNPCVQKVLGSQLNAAVLTLIAEYAFNYKDLAISFLGRIEFYRDTLHIYNGNKGSGLYERWGNDNAEPFACIQVSSPTVNPRNFQEEDTGSRCWHDYPYGNPPMGVQPFPVRVPLRFFINRDGSYKNNGDTVKIVWKGKKLILRCTHEPHRYDHIPLNSFRDAVAERVRVSVSAQFIKQHAVEQAKADAAIAGEWIDSE